jgi:hypothetical protein
VPDVSLFDAWQQWAVMQALVLSVHPEALPLLISMNRKAAMIAQVLTRMGVPI